MRVRDLMTKHPACATPDMSVAEAARLMIEHDCGALPVLGEFPGGAPLGMITDRDIVARVIAPGHDPAAASVRLYMTTPAITIVDTAPLAECVQLLELSQIRRMIVVDAFDRCVGIVAQADIALHASRRATAELVREISRPPEPAFTM